MLDPARRGHMDVSNTVNVTDPTDVTAALRRILDRRYPEYDFSPVDRLVGDLDRLYRGDYPGFRACDVAYHDLQHVMDVSLAMVRLIDGYESRHQDGARLGPERALAGVAAALFHDAGYIRRERDNRHRNGAEYTRIHVSRSARFLSEYLPTVGLRRLLPCCERIVHFTGYEREISTLVVEDSGERALGALLGTADLIAQMADVDYLRKVRKYLYREFRQGGMAGREGYYSTTGTIYRSPQHLMEATPGFIQDAIETRLEGSFGGVYRYAADHFGGPNLYMEAIEHNLRSLRKLLRQPDRAAAGVR